MKYLLSEFNQTKQQKRVLAALHDQIKEKSWKQEFNSFLVFFFLRNFPRSSAWQIGWLELTCDDVVKPENESEPRLSAFIFMIG